MASITKRARGQWRARIRRRGYPLQSATFDLRAEAEAWARRVEYEMDLGIYVLSDPEDPDQVELEAESPSGSAPAEPIQGDADWPLRDALEKYLREISPGKKNHAQEMIRIRKWMAHPLAARPMTSIRPSEIAAYRDARLQAGIAGNTVRLELAALSHLFTVAQQEWGYEDLANPVQRIRKPRIPAGRDRRIKPGEMGGLLGAADMEFACLISLAVETGMRRGELAGLVWDRVDLRRSVVLLQDTKNGDTRSVPLSPAAAEALQTLKKVVSRQIDGKVFSRNGESVTREFMRLRDQCGIKDLHFHDLRHEAISRLFEKTDLDAMEIRSISGHRTMQMLARYTHLRADRLVSRLAGARRGAA